MSPVDTGFPRDSGAKRRMLPSVTDVVRELAKVVSADPAVLFKGARSVVAEELAKVKQGFEAAPLDVLVKRARLQLERDGEATPVSDTPAPMPVFPARHAPRREAPESPPSRPSGATAKRPPSDDPFEDVASRAELNWEKEIPIQPDDAPFRSAIIPIPYKARAPHEISQPIDAPAKVAPEPGREPPPAPKPEAQLEWDFAPTAKVEASVPAAPEPPAKQTERALFSEGEKAERRAEAPQRRGEVVARHEAQLPFEEKAAVPAKSLQQATTPAGGALKAQSPTEEESPVPSEKLPRPAVASAPAVPLVPTPGPERFLRAPTPPARHEPAVKSISEMPPLSESLGDTDSTQPAMEEFRFKAAERPAPAAVRSSRKGWIAAILGVLAIGAGLTWAVREGVFKNEILRSAPPAVKKPDAAPPASAAPAPVPTAEPGPEAKPAALPPKSRSEPARQPAAGPSAGASAPKGRAAVLLTPDWAGKPVVYVIHFSSTKDRESAEKEARKLGAELGAPAHAVEVDLGEKGIWYRVVIGEFKDVDSARAFRAELEAKKTPGMGFVYEMRGR